MKIALLSGLTSIHTIQWANIFAARGNRVHIITCHPTENILSSKVVIHILPHVPPLGYYTNVGFLKKILREIDPDILNAHYASGYGTLARLSEFHPYILSVWGTDVYHFPYKSFFHNYILRKNLLAADMVCSTSHAMAVQTKKVCSQLNEIPVTPFGVDTNIFKPMPQYRDHRYITIGTVKTLANNYGIDTLLHAFAFAKYQIEKRDIDISSRLRLMIVGGGPQEYELKELAKKLKIYDRCIWTGQVQHKDVPLYLNQLDIYIALSRSESFGVAIIEASACKIPVIVSNVGGLPEVVKNGVTGIIVKKDAPQEAGESIIDLIFDIEKRHSLGEEGRHWVLNSYEWRKCATTMEKNYKKAIFNKEGKFA